MQANDLPEQVERYLAELTRRVRETLGTDLLGVWLAGSAALGGFDLSSSDLDVVAVAGDGVARSIREALLERLRHAALPCPARGLEFVLYAEAGVVGAASEPDFLIELNDGPGMPFHAALSLQERPEAGGTFWYVIDRSIVRACGVPLFGPAPSAVFAEPPQAAVLAALAESVRWHLAAEANQYRNAVLNACRALYWLGNRQWVSKPEAGRWYLSGHDEPVVAAALTCQPTTGEQVRPLLQRILQQLEDASMTT